MIPPQKKSVAHRLPEAARDARQELAYEYFADLMEAWRAKGKAVLDTVALLYPDTFLRVVASHMPREMHATVEHNINVSRLSNREIDALIETEIATPAGSEEAEAHPPLIPQLEP